MTTTGTKSTIDPFAAGTMRNAWAAVIQHKIH